MVANGRIRSTRSPNAIAQQPVEPRDAARLLDATDSTGTILHRRVVDLPSLICRGDVLVVNDTRVLPARLRLRKATGGAVEVLLLERHGDGGWEALVRPAGASSPARSLEAAPDLRVEIGDRLPGGMPAGQGRRTPSGLRRRARAARRGAAAAVHHQPLADPERYQTVYADRPGSVAAPTAGLHLTDACSTGAGRRASSVATVDLAVGLDTFRPITADGSRTTRCTPSATRARRRRGRRAATADAGGRGRHDDGAGARVGGRDRATRTGRTDLFIHGDFDVPGRRRAAHELPPAALVAARAARRVRRPALARPLRHARWPRATASCPSATPCSSTRRPMTLRADDIDATDGAARADDGHDRARHVPHAVLHAGRAPGARCSTLDAGRPRGARRRGRARQHVPPDAAAGRRRGRRPRRAARLHRLGRATCSPTPAASRCSRCSPKVDDDGVTFRSTYDGSTHRLTPEGAVAVQEALGADIQMVLDVCPPLPSPPEVVRARRRAHRGVGGAGHAPRTGARARRCSASCRAASTRRCAVESARRTVDVGFDGYGIGGLSVGESRAEMLPALAAALAELPADRPRYLMGVGDPVGPGRGGRPAASTCSTACCRPASPATARSSPSAGRMQLTQRPIRPRRRARSTRPAAAACAPATRGRTCGTCSRSASPRRPACSRSTTWRWTAGAWCARIAGGDRRRDIRGAFAAKCSTCGVGS